MPIADEIVQYLREHALVVTTAESCTAGKIVTLLSEVEGSGEFIECGYVVYSPQAKQRLLHVSPQTIERFNLTSVEVAKEMAKGALRDSTANAAIATTGILGPDDVDGIPAGTICFAWAFQSDDECYLFSHEHRFFGGRCQVQEEATEYALRQLPHFHRRARLGDTGEA
ncbi:CinA family protein [Pseudomonas protegens]|uniref:CinA family protein n=1 Tax=Pseudomonas TaxID=286 RepID=UPI001576F0CA|nr:MULTISPECIES: CinA family protein [Pseudomonas]MBB1612608.1 ompetence-damaged protein [Pseudomonas sp. UMC65]MBB1622856.1 ompetence-damaged protein [Pseudomonas sp. UME65]NTZ73084.1 CinA family protein [Pseudomonas protegens]UCZ85691.1 CinA family protein [Pseudomonas sp. L5B5]